jgi:cell division protein FtsB
MAAEEKFQSLMKQYGRGLMGLIVLVLVVHDIFGAHGFLAMRRTQSETKKVEADLDRLNKENAELADQVKDLKTDPKAIEKLAREMGLAKSGEIIIMIPQSQQIQQTSSSKQ